MDKIREELPRFIDQIQSMLNVLKQSLHLYGGKLWATHGKKRDRYYIFDKGKKVCLRANEIDIARDMSQQEYENRLIQIMTEIIDCAKKLDRLIAVEPLKRAFESLSPAKKKLVRSPFPTDEELAQIWLAQPGNKYTKRAEELICPAINGKMYRSKSEATIADYLDENNIAFKYENELVLSNGITYYPDFTIYMPATRREIIWEHFGMMDDMDYRNKAFLKIRKYEANGLFRHDSFIWTFETGRFPLDTKSIRKMAQEIKNTLGYQA